MCRVKHRGAAALHSWSGAQVQWVLWLQAARVTMRVTVTPSAVIKHRTAPSGQVLPMGFLLGGY